jgi:hypothetical protein
MLTELSVVEQSHLATRTIRSVGFDPNIVWLVPLPLVSVFFVVFKH